MIRYQNVTQCYQDKATFEGLTLHIEKGEFFVLVGKSGSGKTTALKMLNRLIDADSGGIYIDNKPITSYNLRKLRLDIGYVFQQINLFPNLTVAENIALIPEMKGWKEADILTKTASLLHKVGLEPEMYLNRYPKELSGGEQQRVGIVRAIIGNPKVLLMDEPFSALDPISRGQLQSLIKAIHQEYKMTTVLVTHDMQEALSLADRIAVFNQGNIAQIGTPEDIRQNPVSDFVADFFRLNEKGEA